MKYIVAIISSLVFLGCKDKSSEPIMLSSGLQNAESVYLTHDHQGNPVVAWTERSEGVTTFFYSISADDGNSFPNKQEVRLDPRVATHAEGMPKIAFKYDGSIIVAFEKKMPTKTNKYAGVVGYIVSGNKGKSWSSERYLHQDTLAGKSRSYFDIELLPDGEIGASWLDIKLDEETGGRSVFFAKTNAANMFTDAKVIDSSACQCCRTDIYTDENDVVYVAYRSLRPGNMGKSIRDMMVASSTDRGQTFGAPLMISSDNWNIDGCPHTGPSLCSSKTGLTTLWYTEGNGTGVYYANHSDGQNAFSERTLVSNNGHHPQACANSNEIAMLWEENTESNDKIVTTIHYRTVKDGMAVNNAVLTPPTTNAFVPVVTPLSQGFLVAYLMEDNDRINVYLRRM